MATEVTNTALQVESNLKRVEAASAARELAQRRLEAEQSKFEVGMSTNYFVVQAQRDLRDSQNVELRTLLDYRKSLVDFERVQETSLSRVRYHRGRRERSQQYHRANQRGFWWRRCWWWSIVFCRRWHRFRR